jgi:hypothetical protein
MSITFKEAQMTLRPYGMTLAHDCGEYRVAPNVRLLASHENLNHCQAVARAETLAAYESDILSVVADGMILASQLGFTR